MKHLPNPPNTPLTDSSVLELSLQKIQEVQNLKDRLSGLLSLVPENPFIKTVIGRCIDDVEKLMSLSIQKSQIEDDRDYGDHVKNLLFNNILYAKNPIVIFHENELIFCNLAWENITGYTFLEIQQKIKNGEDIMELLYGYSPTELARVRHSLSGALDRGESYEDRCFTLQTKTGELVSMAWTNRIHSYQKSTGETNYVQYSIREGSVDRAKSIKAEQEYFEFAKNLLHREMSKKDAYTAGHIKRVMRLSLTIAGILGYSAHEIKLMEIQAGLHDDGKNMSDSTLLGSPNVHTPEERARMNTHAGDGVINGIENNYPLDFLLGMFHHDAFYSKDGITSLTFPSLIHGYRSKEITDPNMVNNLIGRNIPTVGLVIAIPDMIDAVASRRLYSKFLTQPIEKIIEYIEGNILTSTGLIVGAENEIELDPYAWREAAGEELSLPYCISWKGVSYIPRIERNDPSHKDHQSKPLRIQFDPKIVKQLYVNGKLHENIKNNLREDDKVYRPAKMEEIKACLVGLKEKILKQKSTTTDDETYGRLSRALEELQKYTD